MKPDGILIINAPNRLFGPWDITGIVDCSHTNKTAAQGTHINESTYTETVQALKENGFGNFKTVLPVPKVRNYFLTNVRFSVNFLLTMEKSPKLMSFLYLIKKVCERGGAKFDLI
jgi:hypothetical protein